MSILHNTILLNGKNVTSGFFCVMLKNQFENKFDRITIEVIKLEADEFGGGCCILDDRFDDELTFDGCVGDEL